MTVNGQFHLYIGLCHALSEPILGVIQRPCHGLILKSIVLADQFPKGSLDQVPFMWNILGFFLDLLQPAMNIV